MSLIETVSVESRVEEMTRPAYWKANFPNLTVNERLAAWDRDAGRLPSETRRLYGARMREEGYFQDRNDTFVRFVPLLAEAVLTCKRLDIPPAFIFLFDETWQCFYALDPMLRYFLGDGYKVLPDFWTWHVDPAANEAGWRPHRDKGRQALAADGTPVSLTVWAPLMEATPQNSCMYILPANRDPVYNTEDEKTWKIDLASIRALPGKPGDFFCWNQAVLHWGGASSRFAPHPRLSMALEFQRGDRTPFNTPLIEPFSNLTFEARLKLVGKQILQYKHMYPLAPRFQQLAERLLGQ
ncbi:MAG: hypothetical protein GC201_10460 [Alphaproteobacteria bacterium]|nr:hypothetical protein [Alphaproteobacteria bacterium]